MSKIVNLTQHPATQEQIAEGVFDLQGDALAQLKVLLTFNTKPDFGVIADRAAQIVALVEGLDEVGEVSGAMIGGAPYLMSRLETTLSRAAGGKFLRWDFQTLYSFTERVVEEVVLPDGSVKKTATFRHQGFVEAA